MQALETLKEFGKLAVTVITHVKISMAVAYLIAELSYRCILIVGIVICYYLKDSLLDILPGCVALLCLLSCQNFQIFKQRTGCPEGLNRLLLSHSDNKHSRFTKSCCQPCKITVAANKTEAINLTRIQDIHRIDYHGRISRILSLSVAVLLYRSDGILEDYLLPARRRRIGPVAVRSLVGCYPVIAYLIQYELDVPNGNVFSIYKDCETFIVFHNLYTFLSSIFS